MTASRKFGGKRRVEGLTVAFLPTSWPGRALKVGHFMGARLGAGVGHAVTAPLKFVRPPKL